MCDWCEKLAPSWGPGLCEACQRVRAPAGLRFAIPSRLVGTVAVLSLCLGLMAWGSVLGAWTWKDRFVGLAGGSLGVGVFAILMLRRRRHVAPPPRRSRR